MARSHRPATDPGPPRGHRPRAPRHARSRRLRLRHVDTGIVRAATDGTGNAGTVTGARADPGPPADPGRGLPAADLSLPAVRLEQVALIGAPIDTTVLPDGTVLVAERAGRVRVLIPSLAASTSGASVAGDVLIDVSDRTTTDGERGLLSIAVHPNGTELFLSFTDADGDTLVEAYPLDGTRVTGPPRTIYTLTQPRANHNGGPLLFTPDGLLLIGLGTAEAAVTRWVRARTSHPARGDRPPRRQRRRARTRRGRQPVHRASRARPPRSRRTGCATPGAWRSTGPAVSCGSRTSVSPRARRSTGSR
jgi:glucose/arabinose dehydrogenase